ncbi:MAG: hypothetical protein ACK4MV_15420 [Beijerinckiaceae bacterium]
MGFRNIYLVGSVPLSSAAEVFETIGAKFGNRIAYLPDGETEKLDWITQLETLFANHPDFEPSPEVFAVHAGSKARRRYQLRAGAQPDKVDFGNLGYADAAIASHAQFSKARDAGHIARSARFQIDLVPAHSVLWLFVREDQQALLDEAYNLAVANEMRRIFDTLPHDEIAIQFDIASAVFARLERGEPTHYGRTKAEMTERFAGIVARLADRVQADIPLLFHFCYGDANHKHAIEPTDMGDMVAMANALFARISRKVNLVHMPVPRDRSDEAYFKPLLQLRKPPETELVLGLVHYTDGVEGTRARIDTALRFVRAFSVATECGFGRRDPATIPALLDIHLDASAYRA